MGDHPIQNLMRTTMDSIKAMVDVDTVIGSPVETKSGTLIIPVSRVSFGFVAGGGDEAGGQEDEYYGGGSTGQDQSGGSQDQGGKEASMPFTGGAGAGVSVKPVGFLVVGGSKVRFLPVDSRALFDRLIDEAPELLDKIKGTCEMKRVRPKGDVEEPFIKGPVH